jgi:hypothetical protein
MLISTKQHLLNNLSLSIISLLMGYALWQSMSQPYKIDATFSIPLSFYNAENKTIDAPDELVVTLHGTRKELYKLASNFAIHLDADQLKTGEQDLKVTGHNLFLPESIVLLNYVPTAVTIT